MKLRVCAAVLSVCLLLSVLSLQAFATSSGTVTVDGTAVAFTDGETLSDLCDLSTRRLVYATVTHTDGSITTVTDEKEPLFDVATVTTRRISILAYGTGELRRVMPTGVRFLTSVSLSDLEELEKDPSIASVTVGTVILPVDLAGELADFSHAAPGDVPFLDVPADTDAWYRQVADVAFFAGSVVNIKPENYDRVFMGRGYVRVTFQNGECVTVYAGGTSYTCGRFGSLAAEWSLNRNNSMTDAERELFSAAADRMFAQNLTGLNVLAIGDSLFHGHTLEDDQTWIALLADRYGWNLTNLGRDGWTVAKNDAAYPEGASIRQSMYDRLMNDPNYRYGTGESYYTTGDARQKSAEDVDIILLEGGTNDFGWGLPLGDLSNNASMQCGDNYLGALHLMIQTLKSTYPNATVILVTSWHNTGTAYGRERMDFVADGMKALYAERYASDSRVMLMDAGNPALNGGVNMADSAFRMLYACKTSDVNHLNERGMQLMANGIQLLLWECVTGEQ